MNKKEEILRYRLIWFLDEPYDLYTTIICDFEELYKNSSKLEIQVKTLEFIKYLLGNDLFYVCPPDSTTYDAENVLTVEESLTYIKSMWDDSWLDWQGLTWRMMLGLTPLGTETAKDILLHEIHIKEKVIVKGEKELTSLRHILDFVKDEFTTIDFQEICYETLEVVYELFVASYVEVGIIVNNEFISWNPQSIRPAKYIRELLDELGREPEVGEIAWFRNTPKANALVEKWHSEGGRIVNHWYDLIDNR
jgi:hypothetical protein